MKPKLILAFVLFISVFGFCQTVFAMTDAERQALIAQLQQQILQIQQQIAQMGAQQNGQVAWCHTFKNYLVMGSTDATANGEVSSLQTALTNAGLNASGLNTLDDGQGVFAGNTNAVVVKFQKKYGIAQTGTVGPKTRAKLNELYGCGVKDCKQSWDCVEWSLCINGKQTRTCSDLNNCGVDTKKPKVSQDCTQKPAVKMQANNLDGPVNIFLTLGNGAIVTTSGISMSRDINLKWESVGVSSCTASDSLTPKIFSGYKTSYGSEVITLSGISEKISNGAGKISDTFKITCVSTETGSTVSDSITVNLFYTVNNNCVPSWSCLAWSDCKNKKHTRICTDWNGCGSLVGKPIQEESCVPIVE